MQSRVNRILKKTTKEQSLQQHIQDDSGNDSDMTDDSLVQYSSKYTNRQVFSMAEESELERYIKKCPDINYGLTYEWHQAKRAKEGWRKGFMARHKKEPESTSLSRSADFNKYKVDRFLDNLNPKLRNIDEFMHGTPASKQVITAGNDKRYLTSGVPQWSTLGPTLWNLYYDKILQVDVVDKNRIDIINKGEENIDKIRKGMEELKLELALEKTEAIMLKGRRKIKNITLQMEDMVINTKSELKYLRVWFDKDMRMKTHIRTAEKAKRTGRVLT
ncbi:hypothetical protein ILUMI_09277 [Ignelater luminosus]|uniref:Reverse transcriptase domain-containing protein n=1 Tax=Ignelater luminosus TaxID=2038154 RepID=A0A8K0D9I2_IGNLU|nr:hypothetical protein ILUMI_09277 [Ignelater luminosus]